MKIDRTVLLIAATTIFVFIVVNLIRGGNW